MHRRSFLTLPAAAAVAAPVSKREETRAVWIHPENLFKGSEAEGRKLVRDAVERFASTNFNLILPWVVSDFLMALEMEAYRDSHPTARWDALGVLIDESASRGIPVHIWYSFTAYRNRASSDFDPRVGGDPQWAAIRMDEFRPDPKTGQKVPRRWNDSCPQHHAARRWQRELLLRACARYPKLAGVHIEEPGYDYWDNCLCDLCRETFEKLHGVALVDHLKTPEAENFKCLGTSAFMSELRSALRERFPKLVYSANGGFDYRRERGQGRDWGRWARAGWLDYYAAQVYVTDTARFRERLGMTIRDIGADCPVYAGLGFTWSGGGQNTVAEMLRQIAVSRELGAAGFALFHGGAFTPELFDALRTGPFRTRG
jgi:uncharacterized lipoprotein YddW (UPF0748 family)